MNEIKLTLRQLRQEIAKELGFIYWTSKVQERECDRLFVLAPPKTFGPNSTFREATPDEIEKANDPFVSHAGDWEKDANASLELLEHLPMWGVEPCSFCGFYIYYYKRKEKNPVYRVDFSSMATFQLAAAVAFLEFKRNCRVVIVEGK